uniref:Ig-like domain-containing protein n=1 Tax=Timema poppense TaxID=170557 RepID=A0A7R9H6X2_TIMPO|nr:unnamed protein product [Timema poppensis]
MPTEATAELVGSPDLHIKSGSTLRLVCKLHQSTEAPVYVFWYHEEKMINYDKERGVSVHGDKSSSSLVIAEAQKSDSGNYSCVPSNAKPASINVHVLNGEKPAAMQHGSRSSASSLKVHLPVTFCSWYCLFLLLLLVRKTLHHSSGPSRQPRIPSEPMFRVFR